MTSELLGDMCLLYNIDILSCLTVSKILALKTSNTALDTPVGATNVLIIIVQYRIV